MTETRRKFHRDFKEGTIWLVRETGRSIAQVAKDLGINEGALGNWVNADRRRRGNGDGALGEDERAEPVRLRQENAELALERDVLKPSVPGGRRGWLRTSLVPSTAQARQQPGFHERRAVVHADAFRDAAMPGPGAARRPATRCPR